ncbi:uncharacterized protein LOC143350144 isoform X2 [Colletes latitarsis]|uniref:uncharacterized protein LOC143350144 isoform X2 n=1 Tax=Colletes latitarsis TaxID=2605962 RepID=UPI00403594C7
MVGELLLWGARRWRSKGVAGGNDRGKRNGGRVWESNDVDGRGAARRNLGWRCWKPWCLEIPSTGGC